MTRGVVRLPGDWASTAQAESHAPVTGQDEGLACTHVLAGRVVVTLEVPGAAAPFTDGVGQDQDPLVLAHAGRTGGRAFRFPGRTSLEAGRARTVADVLRLGAVDAVVGLGAGDLDPASRVDLRGFVRPLLRGGRVELALRPAVGGVLVPFEQRVQIACCEDHVG